MQRAVCLALHRHVVQVADAAVTRRRRVNPLHDVARLLLPLDSDRKVESWQDLARARRHSLDQRGRGLDREHAAGRDGGVADEVRP